MDTGLEYGGLKVTQAARLRKAVSNLTLDARILKEAVEGKYQALRGAVLALPMRARCSTLQNTVHAG